MHIHIYIHIYTHTNTGTITFYFGHILVHENTPCGCVNRVKNVISSVGHSTLCQVTLLFLVAGLCASKARPPD